MVKKKRKINLDIESLDGNICVYQVFFIGGANVGVHKLFEKREHVSVNGVVNDWVQHSSRSSWSGSVAVASDCHRDYVLGL